MVFVRTFLVKIKGEFEDPTGPIHEFCVLV